MSGSLTEGLPLYAECRGRPAGPDVQHVVLLHGYGAWSYTWRHWAPHLEARARVVYVDMKGFGRAPKPDDGRCSPHDLAHDVTELVTRLASDRVVLVGHSLGGAVALLTALRLTDEGRRDILEGLVLVASAAYPQRLPPFVAFARLRRLATEAIRWLGPERIVRQVLRTIVFDPASVTEEQVQAYAAPLHDPDARRALVDVALRIVPDDIHQVVARLPTIDVPTLALWGRHDRVVPLWVGRRLQQDLPDCELHVLERCGHDPPEELPEKSCAAVLDYLDSRTPSLRGSG